MMANAQSIMGSSVPTVKPTKKLETVEPITASAVRGTGMNVPMYSSTAMLMSRPRRMFMAMLTIVA